ncbi:MAG: glycosyltransferase family 4 protein [Candidatus Omnitrophica bacterium]|nr:glycosyltransferase family 4 protein [Candidatus Omnitrophota bacterium]
MKVVNIIQRYHPAIGGSEAWCQGMCRYLARQGWDTTVLTMNVFNEDEYWRDPPLENCIVRLGKFEYDAGVLVKRYRRNKIHPFVYRFFKEVLDARFNLYFYGPHSLPLYAQLFRQLLSADIVHLHTIPYPHNFFGYFIARLLGKKIAITPHFHPGHSFYERNSNYWLLRHCDAVFAVSDFEKDYFVKQGLRPEKIFVAYNAVDPNDFKPQGFDEFRLRFYERYKIREDSRIIVFVGRKIDYKGLDTLIEAVRQIVRDKDVRLFTIGPSFPWFEEFYAKLSAEDKEKIIDLGIISHREKVNLLHLADCLVLPSKYEAFGIVFLEAWMCGKPVIGANTGAVSELIKDAGLVCSYGNVEELKDRIELILFDAKRAEAMAAKGKQKVLEHYTWDKVGATILKAYGSLFEGNGRLRHFHF